MNAHPRTLHKEATAQRIAKQCRAKVPRQSYAVIECPTARRGRWYVVQVRDEGGDILGYL